LYILNILGAKTTKYEPNHQPPQTTQPPPPLTEATSFVVGVEHSKYPTQLYRPHHHQS
jgi:hypothetical protein